MSAPAPDVNGTQLIDAARRALVDDRRQLTLGELAALAALPDDDVPALADAAHAVRVAWCGDTVEVEGILSAKTGGCPEDCHFCSQSSQFDSPVKAAPVPRPTTRCCAAARETAELGASEFCLVLRRARPRRAVDGPPRGDRAPRRRARPGINVAVSAGILTEDQAGRLAAAGTHRYNHNLETARSYFGEIVTTHSWEERFDTCRLVREHDMELCCGVLLGMGETDAQRVELLGQLREVEPCRGAGQLPRPPAGHAARRPAPHGGRSRPSAGSPCSGSPSPTSSCATPAAAR